MHTDPLYHVVFDGRPANGVSLDKAMIAMANLFKKTPDGVSKLFNKRPTVIKKGLTEAQALKYQQALQAAGLSCHIAADPALSGVQEKADDCCPKCGHALDHGPESGTPADECPACGIVLKKFKPVEAPLPTPETALDAADDPQNHAPEPETGKEPTTEYVFPASGCLISLASLSFLLPHDLNLDAPLDKLPPPTFGQRIWASVGTFCHMTFLYIVMQILVGVVAGVYLVFSETALTRSTADSLKGVAGMLAMLSAFIVMPIIWRGHTFGQRVMGILLVPTTRGADDEPNGLAMFLRRLTFRTRSARALPKSERPWNKALIPFAAALALHFAVAVPGTALLASVGSFGSGSGVANRSGSVTPTNAFQTALEAKDRNMLIEIHVAMASYMVEYGMTPEPLTPDTFLGIMELSMPPNLAQDIGSALDEGNLVLEGTLADYRIGLLHSDKWLVLKSDGRIRKVDDF